MHQKLVLSQVFFPKCVSPLWVCHPHTAMKRLYHVELSRPTFSYGWEFYHSKENTLVSVSYCEVCSFLKDSRSPALSLATVNKSQIDSLQERRWLYPRDTFNY